LVHYTRKPKTASHENLDFSAKNEEVPAKRKEERRTSYVPEENYPNVDIRVFTQPNYYKVTGDERIDRTTKSRPRTPVKGEKEDDQTK